VLYEIGDPAAYLLPDVIADFSGVAVTQQGPDSVLVTGARGRAPTSRYKVSATWQDGYRAVATISIVGVDAARKAERTAVALVARASALFAQRGLSDFAATHVEVLGAETSYGTGARARHAREVVLRLVVDHESRVALDLFAREIGSSGLSFAPGTTGMFGGRPKPAPVVRLFAFLVSKAELPPPTVRIGDMELPVEIPPGVESAAPVSRPVGETAPPDDGPSVAVPLMRLAHARSGDKGDASNVAILARRPEYLPFLRREVTAARMLEHFRGLVEGPVERFEAPGLNALNFLMHNALGGGGMASRRIDPLGKAYGQMALEMILNVPRSLLGDGPAIDGNEQEGTT
jgi:hypothetical protein